jgi:putative transposase
MLKLAKGNKNVKGEFLYLPIKKNNYSERFKGKLNTSCELVFKDKRLKCIKLTKEIEMVKPELNDITISFDIGLNILIATDKGDCYGKSYLNRLKSLDSKLIKLQNELKEKHGKYVKLNQFKEYNDLVDYIKDYSKNEINRLINKVYKRYKPKSIVVEDLDFRGSNLRKKTNRLLHRFGLGIIKNKLNQLESDYGIYIKYTDAAYSSQVCNNCKYIDKDNRKTQSEFVCKCCGKKLNADVNGSRTVKYFSERFSERKFYGNKGRLDKRTLLINDFINSKVGTNDKRIIQTLIYNPYFKDYKNLFREKLQLS